MMKQQFSSDEILNFKRFAAERAVDFVKSGMVIGLGSGSTVNILIECLGQRIAAGRLSDIKAIPASRESELKAVRNGISIATLNDHPGIELTIDGADEVDPDLNLIKGGGGALFREKIIAGFSDKVIIIVDQTKLTRRLGESFPVPVEVFPGAVKPVTGFIENLGASVDQRKDSSGKLFKTEQDNNILDCRFGPIENPRELARILSMKPGIIEHGLFLDMASTIIVGGKEGISYIERQNFSEK